MLWSLLYLPDRFNSLSLIFSKKRTLIMRLFPIYSTDLLSIFISVIRNQTNMKMISVQL